MNRLPAALCLISFISCPGQGQIGYGQVVFDQGELIRKAARIIDLQGFLLGGDSLLAAIYFILRLIR